MLLVATVDERDSPVTRRTPRRSRCLPPHFTAARTPAIRERNARPRYGHVASVRSNRCATAQSPFATGLLPPVTVQALEPGADNHFVMARDPNELLSKVEDLPPIPAVAAKVLSMVEDSRTSANDLAQVLAADQMLTAKLIKVSNSAYYGFARKVSTVREAVVSIGFKQVRQVAVGASIIHGFKRGSLSSECFDLDLFWGHSMAVAVAAEALAKKSRVCKPEDAFTAGILHDIGRLVIRQGRPEEFERAVRMARTGTISLHTAEVRSTGFAHDEVGKALGELWKFPAHLIDAIDGHHNTKLSPRMDGLAGVVSQANRLILHYGLFCGYDVEVEPQVLPPELAEVEACAGGIDLVLARAFAFIEAASGTPERWYNSTSERAA